jgi:hypothetical protein
MTIETEITEDAPQITYCVPIMNRLGDIKQTLAHNLDVLTGFEGAATLLVGNFDQTDDCQRWIESQFSSALQLGLLRFHRFSPLPFWHFSWAKNAFAGMLESRYYSSLDGDNFLTPEDVSQTLNLISDQTQQFLIHHFSGNWGDGTSGRITVPADLYNTRPYPDDILPRQFDEIAVILKLLAACENLIFVSRRGVNIFEQSKCIRHFILSNRIDIQHWNRDLGHLHRPLDPRGKDYAKSDEVLGYYHKLNSKYVLWKLSQSESARQIFEKPLIDAQRAFCRSSRCYEKLEVLFEGLGQTALKRTPEITLYTVNRNNLAFVQPWLDHYRRLGVKRFVIVDDGSRPPLETLMDAQDVHVVIPRFGTFRTSKVFWIRALMGAFQDAGSWVMTLDIDEFLDVDNDDNEGARAPLDGLFQLADSQGWSHFPALMLDMMPSIDYRELTAGNFIECMDLHLDRPADDSFGYQEHPSVKWAFGDCWPAAFSVDIRYRLFGTVDCLRKIPLVRFTDALDLNQGFHTLVFEGHQPALRDLLPLHRGLLPLRHYKLAKFFLAQSRGNDGFERTEQYFGRTQHNIRSIERSDVDYVWRSWASSPFKRRYRGTSGFRYYNGLAEGLSRMEAKAASRVNAS